MKKLINGFLLLAGFSVIAPISSAWATLIGPSPVLSISAPGNNQVTLNWFDTNDWLQSASSLNPPISSSAGFGASPISPWINVGSAPATSVTLSASQPMQFFRLVVSPGGPPPTELWLQSLSDTNNDYYFELIWDAVPGGVSYNVYMANVPGVTSQNYASLQGGMAFKGIQNIYADIPNVPGGVLTPPLTAGTNYYFVVTAVASNGMESAASSPQYGMVGAAAALKGTVYASLSIDGNLTTVYLPNVSLTLVNQSNPAFSNSVTSDINGFFSFPVMPEGTYNLCWQDKGFVSGCSNQLVLGDSGNTVALQLFPSSSGALLYGQVTFEDGSDVFALDNFFNISQDPVVTLTKNQVTLAKAPVNSSGLYVMAGVPEEANLQVSVTVQSSTVVSNVNTQGEVFAAQPASVGFSVVVEQDLVVPDTPPVIESLIAYTNGVPVYYVPAGTTVQVIATVTGNNLNYEWFDTNGLTSYPNSPTISWTLPADANGFQYLWLVVSDGSGGYAEQRLELDVDSNAFFDGTVLASDTGLPVSNAVVDVNGQETTTDTNGFFSFQFAMANQYDLNISATGYVPTAAVYFETQNDQTYYLTPISTPAGPFCPEGSSLIWVTNDANGVVAGIPGDGLVNSNNNAYSGCFYVSLSALDPCDPGNGFAGGNLDTNDVPLAGYSLVDVCVTDTLGNPLKLAPGATAEVYAPIASSCLDTNFALPENIECFDETNVPMAATNSEILWNALGAAALAYDTVNGVIITNYYAAVSTLGNLLFGAPGCTGPNAVNFNFNFETDASLRLPLTVGFFQDNGATPTSAPDQSKQIGRYVDITYQPQPVPLKLCPGQTVWIEVLSLRQSPGQYYVPGSTTPLPPNQKDVIQALKYTVPANLVPMATPYGKTVTLGLGVTVDVPRSAQLLGLKLNALSADAFLTARSGTADGAATYYSNVDPNNAKKTFAAWQAANSSKGKTWSGISSSANLNAENGYGIYFNANDLGAGRRTGMNLFTDADGKPSVAYYVATYFSLADAAADEKAGGQPGPNNKRLKYIVCMEYSLTLKGTNIMGSRYIKFFAFDKAGDRTGEVPNEAQEPAYVPYLCMNCHGAGPTDGVDTPNGNVDGQFVPFDVANYTFSAAYPPTQAPNAGAFSLLNSGLTVSDTIMPLKSLLPLINYLVANNNSTGGTSFYTTMKSWPAKLNNATAQETSLYNDVYAVSCRSCHVTQKESDYNWVTASGYSSSYQQVIAGPTGDIPGTPQMPHAQRTFGIFWGSATALQLQTQKVITTTPAATSQPMVGGEMNNALWFTPPK